MASWHNMTAWHVPEHHLSFWGGYAKFKKPVQPEAQEQGAVELCLQSKSNRIDSPDSSKILSSLQVTALQAQAC